MMLTVRYEDIVTDFEPTVRRMFDHCGLDFPEAAKTFWRTPRVVDTNSAAQVRKPLYTSGMNQWRQFQGIRAKDAGGGGGGGDSSDHGEGFLGELHAALRKWYPDDDGDVSSGGGGGCSTD